jgi:hypothetical protein
MGRPGGGKSVPFLALFRFERNPLRGDPQPGVFERPCGRDCVTAIMLLTCLGLWFRQVVGGENRWVLMPAKK